MATKVEDSVSKYFRWFLYFCLFAIIISASSFATFSGHPIMAISFLLLAGITAFIFMRKNTYPLRFMYPGLITFFFFLLLPIVFTVIIGFTNLSTGHLLTKDKAQSILLQEVYVPQDGDALYLQYSVSPLPQDSTKFTLWITDESNPRIYSGVFGIGDKEQILVAETKDQSPSELLGKGELFKLFQKLKERKIILPSGELLSFFRPGQLINSKRRFDLKEDGSLFDRQNQKVYTADDTIGSFVSGDEKLSPGYYVGVGFGNFAKLFTDPSIKESFISIFVWTMLWAIGSVFLSFSLGISLALLVNNKKLAGKAVYRVLLIIPYSIPFFISILVFRGLLNKDFGIINDILGYWGMAKVNWLGEPIIAKLSCLMVNLWLGFPYMFLVTTGILQSIPDSVYEAASIDGAGRWATFRHITLPMTFSAIAPLLVGSFAFNLNNFVGIYLLTGGGPPIAGATTPAGHTDILISYTYRLAFEGGSGQDFGLASSIAIIIFFIITIITLFNFKMSGMFKDNK